MPHPRQQAFIEGSTQSSGIGDVDVRLKDLDE